VGNSDYNLREWTRWWAGIICTCYIPLTHLFRLNYEKKRIVIIEYFIKKEEKRESQSLISSKVFSIYLNLFEFLWNFSRECMKKAAWSVLSQLPSSHVWSCIHSRQGFHLGVTNFIQSYLHQFFDDSHGLKVSLKPLRRPFNRYQSGLKAINNGQDIKQINW